ncbi:MAG: nicotinate-nucleotide adenylyltransferase [Clostridiales bacterium]|nr:nicotinate-nucleotide adenylyltransferase [Clostridiales bacterium]
MNGKCRHIGIMGGTFDPVHNAHLTLAEQAYHQFSLDAVWMLPNGNPPHKRDREQAEVEHRVQMIKLAISDISWMELCEIECSSRVYHYTYETLGQLQESFPDTLFYFIMGADSLFQFDDWKEPGMISRECILLAATRDHCRRAQIQRRIRELQERYKADIRILDTPNMDIASEDIRQRILNGADISDMVPEKVAEYIRRHGLYGTA